jgi:phage shock protein A
MSKKIAFVAEEKDYAERLWDDICRHEKEVDKLKKEMDAAIESTHKVRKGIYAKHAELAKKYLDLHERMQIIERNICNQL